MKKKLLICCLCLNMYDVYGSPPDGNVCSGSSSELNQSMILTATMQSGLDGSSSIDEDEQYVLVGGDMPGNIANVYVLREGRDIKDACMNALHACQMSYDNYNNKVTDEDIKKFGNVWIFGEDGKDGIVYYDAEQGAIVVAFRGSKGWADIPVDADVRLVSCDEIVNGGKACGGFVNKYRSVAPLMREAINKIKEINKLPDGTKIILTGHSLGGALASLAAVSLNNESEHVELLTFCTPRVFSQDTARKVNSLGMDIFNIGRGTDLLHQVTPNSLVGHIGKNFNITGKGNSIMKEHKIGFVIDDLKSREAEITASAVGSDESSSMLDVNSEISLKGVINGMLNSNLDETISEIKTNVEELFGEFDREKITNTPPFEALKEAGWVAGKTIIYLAIDLVNAVVGTYECVKAGGKQACQHVGNNEKAKAVSAVAGGVVLGVKHVAKTALSMIAKVAYGGAVSINNLVQASPVISEAVSTAVGTVCGKVKNGVKKIGNVVKKIFHKAKNLVAPEHKSVEIELQPMETSIVEGQK
jgi:hypothetical protein